MKDVDYGKWAGYLTGIFARFGLDPKLVLDLGCGTGSFCMEMAARGYEMIGVDVSPEMLSCAAGKTRERGMDILYLNQDMTAFELYGTVDAIVCLMDSVNYVTSKRDLKRMFKLACNYLNPGGLFVFDVNSRYKFDKILGSNVFYSVEDDISYIWQNTYEKSSGICCFDLTFFAREGELYKRFDEIHYERAYTSVELKHAAVSAGLKTEAEFGEFGFDFPGKSCERIFFVCRK